MSVVRVEAIISELRRMINQSELRLSAQRALLGRIHREIRLVKVHAIGASIVLSVVVDCEPSGLIREDISDAAAEIIADFPEAAKIEERLEVNSRSIAAENVVMEGWVYRRAEP